MELIYKLIQNLLLYFVLAIAEHSVHMGNDAVMLSSVYDAMRNNYVDETTGNNVISGSDKKEYFRNTFPSYELRNKRNINERWDTEYGGAGGHQDEHSYFAHQPQQQFVKNDGYRNPDLEDTGEDVISPRNELICSVYNGKQNSHSERLIYPNPFLDHNNWQIFGGVGYFLGKAVKFVLSGIALVSLPLIFLMAVGIPLKIMMGLKAMTLTNSVVLGSLVYRALNRFLTANSSTTTATPTTMATLRNDQLDQGILEDDYPEYNEEQLQRIIDSIRKKNKDW